MAAAYSLGREPQERGSKRKLSKIATASDTLVCRPLSRAMP